MLKHKKIVYSLKNKLLTGEPLQESDFLPARFTMEGNIEPVIPGDVPFYYAKWPEIYSLKGVGNSNSWPNFQTDCYGAWLWGISHYINTTNDHKILEECQESIDLTIEYLKLTWEMPCYDPWEEYGNERAIGTLGSIAGGLIAINQFLKDQAIDDWVEDIRSVLRKSAAPCGFLPKYIGSKDVDGSALWLFIPYQVFKADDPLTLATVHQIETQLLQSGVKRYRKDVYYGGGEWIILTCWLSWYYTSVKNYSKADALLKWCEKHTEPGGLFPEQVLENLNFPEIREEWESKWWHESPAPLLWSHSMYIIACKALEQAEKNIDCNFFKI